MPRLEKVIQPMRLRVRDALRDLGLTPKQIAQMADLDLRTVQHAFNGSCALDTYDALCGALGWDFEEQVMAPRMGGDRLTSLEKDYERQRAQMAALDRRIETERALRSSRGSLDGRRLRLVSEEDRAWAP